MGTFYKFLLVALVGLAVGCGNSNGDVATPTVSAPSATSLPTTNVHVASSDPLTTRVEQNGVVLTVTLPSATFWASEMVQANMKLENGGDETFAYLAPDGFLSTDVLDARGESIRENPWRGMGIQFGRQSELETLKPGDVVTETVLFQVPATVDPTSYSLWVTAWIDQAPADSNKVEQKLAFKLEAGPIPLPALAPDAAHQLRLHMHAGKDGYQLTTTDGLGNPVSTHVDGMQEIAMGHGVGTGGLQFDSTGRVNYVWRKDDRYAAGGRIEVWVWADGYAANTLAFRTPGNVVSQRDWIAPAVDARKKFDTIRTAQAQFGLKLYTLGYRPEGLQLDSVLGQSGADNGGQSFDVDANYRLRDGSVLKFSQSGYKKNDAYAVAEVRAYEGDAVPVQVGPNTGYVTVMFDEWQLDWAHDGLRFRLIVPRKGLTQAELVDIAAKIVPLP